MMAKLVRYVSPFGSPAWMLRAVAERHLAEDDRLWRELQEIDALTDRQRRVGPPRIEGGNR